MTSMPKATHLPTLPRQSGQDQTPVPDNPCGQPSHCGAVLPWLCLDCHPHRLPWVAWERVGWPCLWRGRWVPLERPCGGPDSSLMPLLCENENPTLPGNQCSAQVPFPCVSQAFSASSELRDTWEMSPGWPLGLVLSTPGWGSP